MRKSLNIFATLLVCVILAGCAGRFGTPTTPAEGGQTIGGGISDTIKRVQDATKKVCGFLPVAQTVATLLGKGDILSGTVGQIAGKICEAVTTRPLADGPGRHKAVVYTSTGPVEIKGQFVKR